MSEPTRRPPEDPKPRPDGDRARDAKGDPSEIPIRLRGLKKSFGGGKQVLDGVDLDVTRGESLVVIGASGTGKSVLLKHIIGLIRPDEGTVEVDGIHLEELDNREITEFRSRFGMAFQEGALFDSMTVAQNVGFPLTRLSKKSSGEIKDRVEECLAMVRLEGVGGKMPSELSGGMRRRVGFARAIAHEPEILLFDEPTTGLDPVTTALIGEVIRDLNERLHVTSVTITHDMEIAFGISNRVAMLNEGKIIAEAPPEEFRKLQDPRVQQFIHGKADGPLSDAIAGADGAKADPKGKA